MHGSQAILGAYAGLFRSQPPPAELMAAMAPFGGGMGSRGQVCGTLAGALAVGQGRLRFPGAVSRQPATCPQNQALMPTTNRKSSASLPSSRA